MTIYVSDLPWTPRDETQERFNLWADTSDEAVMAVFAIGGDLTQRREECNAWEAYAITAEQFADALAIGITITDRFGPVEWCARRDGNRKTLAIIEDARTRGCVP
jgi:hypothetical protein